MRRRPWTAVAALGLLLGACGDDGGDEDVASFCEDVEQVDAELGDDADPQARAQALGQIDPPTDIADDWRTMVELMPEIAEANGNATNDTQADPEDLGELEELEQQIVELDVATNNVELYLSEECDLELGGG